MKKKKIITISLIISVLIIVLVTILLTNSSHLHLKPYDKYELTIIVNTLKNDKSESTTIQFKTDGEVSKATANKNYQDTFLIGNKLKYLEDETIYTYQVDTFYDDLLEQFINIKKADKIEERESYIKYSALLDSKHLNKILEALSIQGKTSKSSVIKMSVDNNHISSVNLSIKDIENFDKIDIMMNYTELSSDYKISTKVLENPHRPYKQERAERNIFELTGENDEK